MPDFDLIVIGSGPAGEKGASQAAYFGKRVALIEREAALGGAAANTGTLPSKTLRETALALSGLRQRQLTGLSVDLRQGVTARDFLGRERAVAASERERVAADLARHGVTTFRGAARFASPNTISVSAGDGTNTALAAGVVLIATGSSPHRPESFPWHDPRVFDSDTILGIETIPRSMLIAGGGIIGCEYACIFATLGIRVTLVEGHDRLLGFLDQEVAGLLTYSMEASGIEILRSEAIASVGTGAPMEVRLRSGRVVPVDALLAATGRDGNTAGLGLEPIAVMPGPRGHLEVNEHYQTAVPHIYAAGDVIGFPALASTAMEQARVAMVHAFDLKYKTRIAPVLPYGIYTIPECSTAGETEESAAAKGIAYVIGKARYARNPRGQIIGDRDGFLKLLFRLPDLTLIGVHIVGEQASELVHTGVLGMLTGATAATFIDMCFNYPTLSDMYKYAAYDALGARDRLGLGET